MRIVHVVVSDAFAGVESHIVRLASGQVAAGHQVTVVGGDSAQIAALARPGVDVMAGRRVGEAVRSLGSLSSVPDVVHAHMTAAELAAALYRPVARRQVPLVVTRHFASRRGRGLRRLLLAPFIASRVTAQIAIGEYTASRIEGPSVVIPAGIGRYDDDDVDRMPIVLMAQRLEREKRPDLGVRAFAASGLRERQWTLQIAGDGSQRTAVEALANELGVAKSTVFLGHRSDVPELMAVSSIFLAPTPGEHFGLSVLEAMAHGLAVVADGSGGHLESLGDVGLPGLYPTLDPLAAADRIRRLAEDPVARRSYGQSLRRRQQRSFSLDHQVNRTTEVYQSAVEHLRIREHTN